MTDSRQQFRARLILTTVLVPIGLVPIGLIPGGAASAQSALLEEIVVTSQKREQSLQDVSVAVSVVTGDKLEQYGVQNFEDLTVSIPNVHVGENTIGDGLFIRGIGSGVNQGFEQSVGIFMDDVYYGRGRITRAMMFDLERVEILKGPQGILFGKNTIGGALNIASRSATYDFSGYVDGRYEFIDNEIEISGAVSGPISDKFRVRVAARYRDLGGYIKNVVLDKDQPSREEIATRVTAVWDIADNLEAIIRFQYGEMDIYGRNMQPSFCTPAYVNFAGPIEDCTLNRTRASAITRSGLGNDEFEKFKFHSMGLTVNWDIQDHTITSVTSYVKYDDTAVLDADYTDKDLLNVDQKEEFDVISQELRLTSTHSSPLQYIIGAYYETTNLQTLNDWHVNAALRGQVSGTRAIDNDQDSEAWAVFAQLSYDITDQFTFILGARYTEETKSNVQDVQITDIYTRNPNAALEPFFKAALNSEPHFFDASRKTSNFNPSATIEWRPDDGTLIYGSVKTGFKAGGYDHAATTANISVFEYDDEKATSYELGTKLDLLGGAATLNIAAFYSTYKNLQVSAFDGAIGFTVGNAAKVTSKGVEVDGRWRVNPDLTLGLTVAYLDSKYDAFPGAQCYFGQTVAQGCVGGSQDLAGKPTQFSPKWSGNLNVAYVKPISSDYEILANLDVNFTDKNVIANDVDPYFIHDAYAKVDARIGLANVTQGWEVAVLGKNLTNKKTYNWGNDTPLFPGSYYKHLERPLTIAIQGRVRF